MRICALLAGLALSCASHGSERVQHRPKTSAAATPASSTPAPLDAEPVHRCYVAAPPTVLITEPAVLAALERQGLALGAMLGAAGAETNDALARSPAFAPLIAQLERELVLAAAGDKLAGVDVARYSHRLFDRRFFHLAQASFRLAGIANRADRAAFDASSCGETRLIYRLAYALDGERASKLPMTLGVELKVPRDGDCAKAAARWREPAHGDADARAAWLRSAQGPLAPSLLPVTHETARVVVNLQLVRWPSTVRPDLGGHAEYLLRAFRPNRAGVLEPERLENTIDPAEFRDPRRRQRLLTWLQDNAAAVDAGTALLPEEFLATRALSVTPRGLSRLANRPFSAALAPDVFAQRDFGSARFAKSAAGLLRRLDQLSCQGCHEARSVAGFHLLGEDAADAPPENALAVPVSAHVLEDLQRRERIVHQMSHGDIPDLSAPFAERASARGGYGAHCGLGSDATFADWGCDAGLRCSSAETPAGDAIGQCLPSAAQVGDSCERGAVAPNADRRRDRVERVSVAGCGDMICNRSAVGFPGGMCTASCGAAGSTCGAIAILDPFNACLARGDSFLTCIRGNVSPAGLRACSADQRCRDDYVCARAEHGGVCLPPYFVFQLRVDGHSSGLAPKRAER